MAERVSLDKVMDRNRTLFRKERKLRKDAGNLLRSLGNSLVGDWSEPFQLEAPTELPLRYGDVSELVT